MSLDLNVCKMMKAVVFKGPYRVSIEDQPTPSILQPTDAIIRIVYSGLCGSDLHIYRVDKPTNCSRPAKEHEPTNRIYLGY